jgi:hypothetical protein
MEIHGVYHAPVTACGKNAISMPGGSMQRARSDSCFAIQPLMKGAGDVFTLFEYSLSI